MSVTLPPVSPGGGIEPKPRPPSGKPPVPPPPSRKPPLPPTNVAQADKKAEAAKPATEMLNINIPPKMNFSAEAMRAGFKVISASDAALKTPDANQKYFKITQGKTFIYLSRQEALDLAKKIISPDVAKIYKGENHQIKVLMSVLENQGQFSLSLRVPVDRQIEFEEEASSIGLQPQTREKDLSGTNADEDFFAVIQGTRIFYYSREKLLQLVPKLLKSSELSISMSPDKQIERAVAVIAESAKAKASSGAKPQIVDDSSLVKELIDKISVAREAYESAISMKKFLDKAKSNLDQIPSDENQTVRHKKTGIEVQMAKERFVTSKDIQEAKANIVIKQIKHTEAVLKAHLAQTRLAEKMESSKKEEVESPGFMLQAIRNQINKKSIEQEAISLKVPPKLEKAKKALMEGKLEVSETLKSKKIISNDQVRLVVLTLLAKALILKAPGSKPSGEAQSNWNDLHKIVTNLKSKSSWKEIFTREYTPYMEAYEAELRPKTPPGGPSMHQK